VLVYESHVEWAHQQRSVIVTVDDDYLRNRLHVPASRTTFETYSR
jgi:hypothetical protein